MVTIKPGSAGAFAFSSEFKHRADYYVIVTLCNHFIQGLVGVITTLKSTQTGGCRVVEGRARAKRKTKKEQSKQKRPANRLVF